MKQIVAVWLWPAAKGHAVTLWPLLPLGWGGEWKEKGKNILVGQDKGSLTEQQTKAKTNSNNNNNTYKENTQNKQRNAQSNSHCPVPHVLLSRGSHPPAQLPPHPEPSMTRYQIPCSVWPGWVSLPGCVPSCFLVKINPVLAKPRTQMKQGWDITKDTAAAYIFVLHSTTEPRSPAGTGKLQFESQSSKLQNSTEELRRRTPICHI